MTQPSLKTDSHYSIIICLFLFLTTLLGCKDGPNRSEAASSAESAEKETVSEKVKVIFDTDANNELDDQHALAYLLFNGPTFDLQAVTVNATYNGGDINGHYEEAERVLQLCNLKDSVPLLKGANGGFSEIAPTFDPENYDGQEAVDFILESTKKDSVIIIAVGKLTNVALALKKDPSFASRTRIVWLGSNYPEPGEYNQDNDTIAMNYVLNTDIPFEMVTVRYGDPSGTDAVKVTQSEINTKMPGLGPKATSPITGRHGGTFETFGDYSVSLFEYIDYHGDPPSRPLFDMVAVALLKNQAWGEQKTIPAPVLIDNTWIERPDNPRKIILWENFDKQGLLEDFYATLENPKPISK
ncbi:nucleoside hydrolase [Poritiphilus flavus]|uniref:Nucleoside hydrolase n=1 Tax=Poritiphilus flavus TaxID=2697053 RepID=A0A6L9E7W0_9FLAO|nr:nucleoside hydrolase [Poritiphilus flavus]NAS10688.1 nucleoside hydrolase [Poritiphilus flavus]